MIQRIRNNRLFKGICVMLALNIFFQIIAPLQALALTGGPSQPEFSSFTPVGTSDMVDLSSGDMNYNIPLMDVGGYPINMSYAAGVGMDQEATWTGLGWNLSVGQINKDVRGIPDDFNGDEMTYENYLKSNFTVGVNFKLKFNAFGVEIPATAAAAASTDYGGNVSVGLAAVYNNYTGFAIKPSVGIQLDLGNNASVGFNAESGPDGLTISPNLSIHQDSQKKSNRMNNMGANIGVSMNSRQGLSSTTLGVTKQSTDYKKNAESGKKERNETGATGSSSVGSTIGFVGNDYTPSKRVGMSTGSFTFNAAQGGELIGAEPNASVTAYGTLMKVQESEKSKVVKAYGYNNTDKANIYGVLDFNREKDGSVSKNTTNLPITNYTYDIYSIQGQGVSGMYRAFRNQVGYVFDTYVQDNSTSGSLGLEFGIGNAAHTGVDVEVTMVNSHSGLWELDNTMLSYLKENYDYNPKYEKIHHKNVGDLAVDTDFGMFDQVAKYAPIRVHYVGSKFHRRIVNSFKFKYNGEGNESIIEVDSKIKRNKRHPRNQSIYNLTIGQLKKGIGNGPCVRRGANGNYYYEQDVSSSAKDHHIGEVQITRNDGARYIYGLPAYNNTKKEATFAVENNGDCNTGLVTYNQSLLDNPENLPNDKFLSRVTTPAYVHSHLLTSVLSADYYDITNNGPSVDDLGSYTKFTYEKPSNAYHWRTPFANASYNEGLKTDTKDDQGNYVYGTKEMFLIKKIQTKTHVARFFTSPRKDAKGVSGESGGIGLDQNSYKLDSIALYSIREYDESNLQVSTPIKVVHFVYDYSLCKNVPNNVTGTLSPNELSNNGGKLTLKKVFFTYRKSKMGKYTGYNFDYSSFNPDYNVKGYDSWGNYKPNEGNCSNLSPVTAAEFPFTEQNRTVQDLHSEAWSLKKIKLPSGGEIDVVYESDDYAYVQDRKAMKMYKVVGAGDENNSITDLSDNADELFGNGPINKEVRYLYVEVPDNENLNLTETEIENKYLKDINEPIYFRFFLNMTTQGGTDLNDATSKFDYVTGYFEYEETSDGNPKIFEQNSKKYLSIPVNFVDKEGGLGGTFDEVHPISKAAWQFGRKYLSKYVYDMMPNGESEDVAPMVAQLLTPNIFNNLLEIFTGPNGALENKLIGRRFIKNKSWIRLNETTGFKLGGGCRVKEIRMVDIWNQMNSNLASNLNQTMTYGQTYSYKTVDGLSSSGVATYEPVGNKENPFVRPVFSTKKHLLAPDEENFIEEPFGESFFPNPQVTYSRVTVSSLHNGIAPTETSLVKKLHKTGKVITEFYTTKDYPVIVDQTILQADEDKRDALASILNLYSRKHFSASQGYVVHLNDMNGKQKAQWVYAEGQTAPISGVEYLYDNYSSPTGINDINSSERNKGKLNNQVKVIYPNGEVKTKTIGVEVDVVNDFRENATETVTQGINANLATFFVGIIPGIVPIPLPDVSYSKDQFRSVSTTKVINTFGILKETIAHDAGAKVSTRNLAWDAITGEVLVTQTVDEYDDNYYTLNYPAHWFYKGMGHASQNLGLTGTFTSAGNQFTMVGTGGSPLTDFLIEGDEMYFYNTSTSNFMKAWVVEIQGSTFKLMDANGVVLANLNSSFEIVRSGYRNLQSAGIMNITLMRNPLINATGSDVSYLGSSFLMEQNWEDWKIINAGAVDYSDFWKVGCECSINTNDGIYNPYVVNEKGVWRTKSSRTYLTGRNQHNELTPRVDGFFSSFSPMYKLSAGQNWFKDFTNWTYVAEVSKFSPYGFEIENVDALTRYSAAQYGFNNMLPLAVGANTRYTEIGYDGFEDYGFVGCSTNSHFSFIGVIGSDLLSPAHSHTGRYSVKVGNGANNITLNKILDCSSAPVSQP